MVITLILTLNTLSVNVVHADYRYYFHFYSLYQKQVGCETGHVTKSDVK